MFNEKISSTIVSTYIQAPEILYDNAKIKLSANASLLNQDKVKYNHGAILNICIVYGLSPRINNTLFTLGDCLFGAVKLTKSTHIDKYKYSGYGIGFDSRGIFHIQMVDMVKMLLFLELIPAVLSMLIIKQEVF